MTSKEQRRIYKHFSKKRTERKVIPYNSKVKTKKFIQAEVPNSNASSQSNDIPSIPTSNVKANVITSTKNHREHLIKITRSGKIKKYVEQCLNELQVV